MSMNRNLAVLALMLFFAARPGVGGVEDILGKWVAKAQTPHGPLEMEFELKMEGNQLLGSAAAFQGSFPLSGLKFEDPNLSLEMNFAGTNFKLTGLLKEGRFSGKWEQVGTEVQGTWTAERKRTDSNHGRRGRHLRRLEQRCRYIPGRAFALARSEAGR